MSPRGGCIRELNHVFAYLIIFSPSQAAHKPLKRLSLNFWFELMVLQNNKFGGSLRDSPLLWFLEQQKLSKKILGESTQYRTDNSRTILVDSGGGVRRMTEDGGDLPT